MSDLFDLVCAKLNGFPDRKGRFHADCPFCGKEAKRGQVHFTVLAHGYHCFVCGEHGSHKKLAEFLGQDIAVQYKPKAHKPAKNPDQVYGWMKHPDRLLEAYSGHPERIAAWQKYKPLSVQTIEKYQLGVGTLPSTQCTHKRLIYPIFGNDRIVAFRGRSTGCDCPKWLSAAGSQLALFGRENLQSGAKVIICENPVDCMLVMQYKPNIAAIAGTSGAATWREEWTRLLVDSKPAQVIVWLDNDLAGQANRETYDLLCTLWHQEHPVGRRAPLPNGPKIANTLLAFGLPVQLYRWPKGTPVKHDIGSVIMGIEREEL